MKYWMKNHAPAEIPDIPMEECLKADHCGCHACADLTTLIKVERSRLSVASKLIDELEKRIHYLEGKIEELEEERDKEDNERIHGEVGEGEELRRALQDSGGGEEATKTSRVFQAPKGVANAKFAAVGLDETGNTVFNLDGLGEIKIV